MKMPAERGRVASWISGKKINLEQLHRGRQLMWDFDRRLLNQVYRQPAGFIRGQTTSPGTAAVIESAEPRNVVRLGLDIMTQRDIRWQALIHDQEAQEQDAINDFEQVSAGVYRDAVKNYRRTGGRALLRDLDWYILMGGFAVAPLVMSGPNGTRFTARILDPRDVFAEYDPEGISWVAHAYRTKISEVRPRVVAAQTRAQQRRNGVGWNAQALMQMSDNDHVDVINAFWWEEDDAPQGKGVYNALLVAGHLVKPPTMEKQFASVQDAINTGPSSGAPPKNIIGTITGPRPDELLDHTATSWEGILAPARRSFIDLDTLLGYSAEIVRRNALGRYIQRTRTGQPRMNRGQFRDMELGTMAIGEDIIPVPPPTSPAERNELLTYYLQSIQRSTLSFTAFGSLGLEISGVTVDSLNKATQSVLNPYVDASQYAVAEMVMSLLNQFRLGDFKAVSLQVRSRGKDASISERLFIKDYDSKDLPKTTILVATQPLSLPDTTLQRIQAVRTALGDNRQIMSEQTAYEVLLQDMIPDSKIEQDRIDKDKVRTSPQADALAVMNGLREVIADANSRGDREMAMMALNILQATLAQFEQLIAGQGQRVAGIDAQREAQGGPAVTEPSPEVQPPEASGAPPDRVNPGSRAVPSLLERRTRNTR